ncbi:uncharacterized protein [Aegilops tauschii subsp. strangulata]|uniref:uncharacterized protein n=1 Tax=Aegilops tauschii subsp. strangulata TaxID=200361 RepID=UPI00098B0D26|nr:uncharacterized protein LOC109752258 [Aegilops tauschii subsp. strangulata]
MRGLSMPVAADIDGATMETFHVSLLDSAKKLAAMRCLTEAYQHEMDRGVDGTPAAEEEDAIGLACFSPRIRDEPFPKGFSLPQDTPKYTGFVKPEDWLVDYSTVVSIANGNKRVAVKYVPLMLQGTAWTKLNNLKPYSGKGLPPPPAGPPASPPQQLAARPDGRLQNEFPEANATYFIFTSEADDKHSQCQHHQEVNAVAPEVPEFMHWSERPISWSHADHPTVMPSPGSYAMVLDSTFSTERRACRFYRILIDGGTSINILYHDTMEKLGIKEKQLVPSRTIFHGIVPGLPCSPIGTKGIITKAGDYQKSAACAATSSRLAQSLIITEEKHLLDRVVAMASKQLSMPSDPKDTEAQGSFQPAKETKKIALDPAHPERHPIVGTNLDSK